MKTAWARSVTSGSGGVDIPGAVGVTYTLVQADVGSVIRVVASYTDGQGTAEVAASADTTPVTNPFYRDEPTIVITTGDSAAIQQILNDAVPGDIIEIAAGDYSDSNVIEITVGGTASDEIILRGEEGSHPILSRLRFTDAQHWRVTSFEISNHPGEVGIDVDGSQSEDLIFNDLELHHMKSGIRLRDGSEFKIWDSTIYEMTNGQGSDASGVRVDRARNIEVRNSEIYDFTGDGITFDDGPENFLVNRGLIQIDGNEIYVSRPDYRGNTENALDVKGEFGGTIIFSNNILHGFDEGHHTGPISASGCGRCEAVHINSIGESGGSHLILRGNLIYDSNIGVDTDTWSAEIYNNVFYDLARRGVSVESDQPVEIYHNTFVSIQEDAVKSDFADQTIVTNNLFFDAGTVDVATTNNAFFGNNSAGALGSDPVTGDDPGLLDVVALDFRLASDSPLIDAGTDVGILVDKAGTLRDANPDVGAYESTDNNPDPGGSVTIAGIATEDEILTASNTLADEDGLGPISYQWQRDAVDIPGAVGVSYTLVQADVGSVIRVVAGYTDEQGTAESVASAPTAAVTNVNDLPTGSVTITGIASEDEILTASNTLADEDGLGPISYQWQRGGVDILGAVGVTYTLVQADVGSVIEVVAGYTDGHGTTESVASAPTAAVNPPPPAILYFSLNVGMTLPGAVTVANEDIIGWNGTDFSVLFDGSDVGLDGARLDAVTVISANEILISISSRQSVPGIAGTVDDSDIVKFVATQLGDTTAGTFDLYFDGSDVGLANSSEDVDALDVLDDGRLVISTNGSFSVPEVSGLDEDLLVFTPTSLGGHHDRNVGDLFRRQRRGTRRRGRECRRVGPQWRHPSFRSGAPLPSPVFRARTKMCSHSCLRKKGITRPAPISRHSCLTAANSAWPQAT